MQPSYQLQIADFYNILIGTVKKLVPNFFDKEKYVRCASLWKLTNFFKVRIEAKKLIVYQNSINHNG